jgi:hypothetical protein
METRLYTVAEAATALGTTSEAIRQRIRRGKLDVVKGNEGLRVRLGEAELSGLRSDGERTAVRPSPKADRTLIGQPKSTRCDTVLLCPKKPWRGSGSGRTRPRPS